MNLNAEPTPNMSLYLAVLAHAKASDRERLKRSSLEDLLAWADTQVGLLESAGDIDPLEDSDREAAIPIFDVRYPPMLREIFAPPLVLFARGNVQALSPERERLSLAIVGSRRCGLRMAHFVENLAAQLAAADVDIISGLAYGVDIAAHRGALCAKRSAKNGGCGRTVAVFGTPLDKIYPVSHRADVEQILESGGAVVSQYPKYSTIRPNNFLERNRIVAGISHGTIVAQASARSGSLATARFALEENREVFVLPGDVTDESFLGSNRLLQAGAVAVTDAAAVLSYFGRTLPTSKDAISDQKSPPWLLALGCAPLPITQFFGAIPQAQDPFEVLMELEIAGKIQRLPGDQVIVLS